MKKLIVIFLLPLYSCSIPTLIHFTEDEKYISVFDVPGTQNELFLKANSWMIGIFKDPRNIIQHSDKEEGVLIGKYLLVSFPMTMSYTGADVYGIIDIRVKDGKARLEIKPMDFREASNPWAVGGSSKQQVMDACAKMADDFLAEMTKGTVEF